MPGINENVIKAGRGVRLEGLKLGEAKLLKGYVGWVDGASTDHSAESDALCAEALSGEKEGGVPVGAPGDIGVEED